MAFNFNWSPLIADTSRARDMLTTALNKSPKPPIIVDDIIVTELNLGSVPPELEILEIGDLAEDRFRGIFKMSYTGDAFLTLKTRVQANPLNTYLSTKPSFASPQPLAAASGLTIPLQITLSDIRLSGFVILVFSRQKGLTLVFRNDPLESLKVSSTFDSIPFVRDYLQKEIEGQLRVLFMEDLPAILHRLSLRLWSPEYQELDKESIVDTSKDKDTTAPIDPLASPPQDPINVFGDDSQISEFSLDPPTETHASFSQKNLLRLATLTESHRTLSLFTPSVRDAVFRAWAGAADRGDSPGPLTPSLTQMSLSRVQSTMSTRSSTPSVSEGTDTGSSSSRPTLSSFTSGYQSLGLGRSRAQTGRKKKRRVVNLRRNKDASDTASDITETSTPEPSVAASETSSVIHEEREEELNTPPKSPTRGVHFSPRRSSIEVQDASVDEHTVHQAASVEAQEKPHPALQAAPRIERPKLARRATSRPPAAPSSKFSTGAVPMLRSYSFDKLPFQQGAPSILSPTPLQYSETPTSGGILEQAWMMKMATEIARKVQDEKERMRAEEERAGEGAGSGWPSSKDPRGPAAGASFWERTEDEEAPPPAYVA